MYLIGLNKRYSVAMSFLTKKKS